MPKIIKNGREKLMESAKRIVLEEGLEALTIRKVAEDCGFSIGMVYNYFESKEQLTLSFMLEDWNRHLESMEAFCEVSSPRDSFRYIYHELGAFTEEYAPLFQDPKAIRQYLLSAPQYRGQLVSQLAGCVESALKQSGFACTPLETTMIANELLLNRQNRTPYEELEQLLLKLIR